MNKKNVEAYSKFADSLYHKRVINMLQNINFTGDENVLDIGCGDGKITAEIASIYVQNGKVLGIDSSDSMLDFAKSKFPSSIYYNLDFQYGNAQDFTFDSQFDLIVSFDCFHAIVNHVPLLSNIHRSLKDNGKVVLGFRGKDTLTTIINDLIKSLKWKPRLENKLEYNFYETEVYSKLLEKSGFNTQKIELNKSIVAHHEKMGLIKQIQNQWFSLSSRVPLDLYGEFISELVEVYLQVNPPDSNGIIYLQEAWLEIEATKNLNFN